MSEGSKGSQKVDYLKDKNEGKASEKAAEKFNTNRQYISDVKNFACFLFIFMLKYIQQVEKLVVERQFTSLSK
ncbi:MAG: hypothetical protein UU10_C0005G0007 [Parcubacteria group bacterium GW2011_GWF1_40_6]|uniref:Uncharacterized protein n=2 Tax=Candidatus Nomuraibacteriota TaxID=1752729 RepID=A0A0G0QNJ9_9BACT|nr:MAG: hypothetical protein UT78_C0018G0006 [Candidatus Nomurabacteria bacterium GW2011_GWF2_40_12]KKR69778.1 MAG: hypothetical protein UU10_C0005G0007 [Parcubacteria group bacterium GW2011_GWF1_40_6]OGJ09423.1 MAG: hypothetical protein A2356_01065 [Candidatus Nomurabacteria bacterium RIFOXYB1_FULL_39_16]OGJ14784.1 MAG: hypothetical protein A2585_03900 [Candidatus Nomurabacteria bacterium RIFOXYD1_FULL_39_12]